MVWDGTISGIRMRKVSAARVRSFNRLTAKASATPRSVEMITESSAVCSVPETGLSGRGIELVEVAGRWRFQTAHDLAFLMTEEREEPRRLSKAALETLAIIAYHQPVTRAEIESVRGVSLSTGTLDLLLEMGFVRLRGRRRTAGRPVTYGTADRFLEHFGLASLYDLPGVQEMKAAGLLDLSAPVGFELPDPSRATGADEDEAPLLDEDSPEFAQDFVGEER